MTVTDLKKKGATALGDAQLKTLIVGKAFWVRNNVTGDQFSVSYTAEGQSNVWHVGRSATTPSSVGNPMRDGYQGTTTPYKIENGKVVTTISQDPFAVTIYKLGDTYYGARSNEFGYANYEIIPTPQIVANPLTAMIDQFSIELGLTEQQKTADCSLPEAGTNPTGGAEEEHRSHASAEGGAVEANQQRRRCQNHASPGSGATAEVPGHPRREPAETDRGDGKQGDAEGGRRDQAEAVEPGKSTSGLANPLAGWARAMRQKWG